jgi:hypothetical protein
MVEWHNGRTAGMANGMVKWWEWLNGGNGGRNGRMQEWWNGQMAAEWRNGRMARMAEWNGRMRNSKNGRMAGMAEWYMKQSITKGYEDELQAHFNSII